MGQAIRPWMPPLVFSIIKSYSPINLVITLKCNCKLTEPELLRREYLNKNQFHYCINGFVVNVVEDRDTGDESDR